MPDDRQISDLTVHVITQPARLAAARAGVLRCQDLAEQVRTVLGIHRGVGDRHPQLDGAANRVGNRATLRHGSCLVCWWLCRSFHPYTAGPTYISRHTAHITRSSSPHILWSIEPVPRTVNREEPIYDADTEQWVSRAEVAEIDFTAFTSKATALQIPGRLVLRRIPDLQPQGNGLFQVWRFHAFFTTSDLDTVSADKTHRGHAIIEQVHADLKASALAPLPSGTFNANAAAWLVCAVIAFNLTRAAACLSGTRLAKATTPTIRRTLICIPARIASSARRISLHLPARWPWEHEWNLLFNNMIGRRQPA